MEEIAFLCAGLCVKFASLQLFVTGIMIPTAATVELPLIDRIFHGLG